MTALTIAVLPGDGIGEEVMSAALAVLERVAEKGGHHFVFRHALVGGAAFDAHGVHFPDETRDVCRQSDAILFGSVGGPVAEMHLPKWRGCEASSILAIRKAFSFHANLRPVTIFPGLERLCPLRGEIVAKGVDILFVRELLGDIYFGEHRTEQVNGRRVASDVAVYTEDQIAAVAKVAFRAASSRRGKVTSVDKANVLDTSKLWRAVVGEVASDFPSIVLEHMLVDNCAMQLIRDPSQFDVIVTSNMFGDILSDAGAVLPGSLGLMASASFNEEGFGLYEPPGGSAQDIAGRGIANPIAQILSAAMMLRFSFGLTDAATAIERAVALALSSGARTADIAAAGEEIISTQAMTERIIESL